jgi:hypothetical protein
MSARELKGPAEETGERQDRWAYYVYGIGERAALAPLFEGSLPEAIEPELPLELVACGEVAAIASAVTLDVYNEEALETHLTDLQWTALRAMRHATVLDHFAARAGVVPLRFGTIYLERGRVAAMLRQQQEELLALIGRLSGREEWSLQIYRDRAALNDKLESLSPRLREAGEQIAEAPPGQAYLLRKKTEALRAEEAHAVTRRVVAEIERDLSALCDTSTRQRLPKEEATWNGELVAKLAFLLERSRFPEFRAAAERLAQAHTASGFKLELVGPWPAYSFAAMPDADPRNAG